MRLDRMYAADIRTARRADTTISSSSSAPIRTMRDISRRSDFLGCGCGCGLPVVKRAFPPHRFGASCAPSLKRPSPNENRLSESDGLDAVSC